MKKSLPLVWISEFGHINIVSGQISWIIHLIFNVRTGTTIYNLNTRGFRCHLLLVVCFSRPKTVRYAAWHYKLALLITWFECILIIISTLACSSNTFTVYCTSLRILSYKIGIYIYIYISMLYTCTFTENSLLPCCKFALSKVLSLHWTTIRVILSKSMQFGIVNLSSSLKGYSTPKWKFCH